MLYAILLGIVLGVGGAEPLVALGFAIVLLLYRAIVDVILRRSPITGIESDYVTYVTNLRAQGNNNPRPWISYLVFFAITAPPLTMACYFASRWLFRK